MNMVEHAEEEKTKQFILTQFMNNLLKKQLSYFKNENNMLLPEYFKC